MCVCGRHLARIRITDPELEGSLEPKDDERDPLEWRVPKQAVERGQGELFSRFHFWTQSS